MTEEKRNPIGRFIEEKLVPISTGFAQNRYVRCIGTGSQSLMAIIMIGAVFNLLNSIRSDIVSAGTFASVIHLVVCTYEIVNILVDSIRMMTEFTVAITAEQQITKYAFLTVFSFRCSALCFGY